MSKIFDKNTHGVSQLVDSPNQWAKDLWRKGCANHWMPQEIDMSDDARQWREKDALTEDERLLVKRTLGLFAAGESLVNNSIASVERIYITDGAMRQYLSRKDFEESLHNWTVETCCEAYDLDVEEVCEAYKNIPTIKKKDEFLVRSLDSFGSDFNIESNAGRQQFVKNMFVFYMICEGTWFFTNFALIMSLGRQNKLIGLDDQIKYTVRDESLHVEFGENTINIAKEQYPGIWTKSFQEEISDLMREGVEIEIEYAKDILPNGVLGVTADSMISYVKYLSNTRMKAVGLEELYPGAENPFLWLSETQDAVGMSAFFERREKNYQQSGMLDDDFKLGVLYVPFGFCVGRQKKEYIEFCQGTKSEHYDTASLHQDVVHGILGLATEVGEIKKALLNRNIDYVNVAEEVGDLLWYVCIVEFVYKANLFDVSEKSYECETKINSIADEMSISASELLDVIKRSFFYGKGMSCSHEDLIDEFRALVFSMYSFVYILNKYHKVDMDIEALIDKNMKKLAKRFNKNKFTTEDVYNRDLDAEREILEEGMD